ncbi:MAG: metabolite traffic protein EboE [Fuerstia sp.]|nr:metabolite traffic protein EboE [Fuerstiella sp.]
MTLSRLPLSYCTNVHPGRTVAEVMDGLTTYSAEVQRQLDFPMAAGLWLSASVVRELTENSEQMEQLAQVLWQHDLCCYTLNTFPYGDFHSERVKEQVYLPDWASFERIGYTEQCAAILGQLLPEGGEGSLSTVPLGGRMNSHDADFHAVCFSHLIRLAKYLHQIYETTGRRIRLGLEPEPMCEMSGTAEWTLPVFAHLFAQAEALGCEPLVREYIGACFDVCHQAVEFEDVADSIEQFVQYGIRINKVHITNAVELLNPSENVAGRQALRQFVEPRYLHQTYARFADGRIEKRLDLTLKDIQRQPADEFMQAESWRVHFHVPIFAETLGALRTTREDLAAALRKVATLSYAPQLEVETYTWPVMPGETAADSPPLADRIAQELRSAADLLGAANV